MTTMPTWLPCMIYSVPFYLCKKQQSKSQTISVLPIHILMILTLLTTTADKERCSLSLELEFFIAPWNFLLNTFSANRNKIWKSADLSSTALKFVKEAAEVLSTFASIICQMFTGRFQLSNYCCYCYCCCYYYYYCCCCCCYCCCYYCFCFYCCYCLLLLLFFLLLMLLLFYANEAKLVCLLPSYEPKEFRAHQVYS